MDDSAFMRGVLRDILLRHGFSEVHEAKDGEEAVKAYQRHSPDLVTMDVIMPGADGVEVARTILGMDRAAKIIMVTAVGQEGAAQAAIRQGARNYIVKPFEEPQIVEAVSRVLGK